ncbi:anhydro-N-acetylmuramic acid kinase [Succinivibrio faecicola]|uniref:Anhydro-N-acetylmuramic acid kinase n=2 Tax=Succinivibrio TaxID=83770 RepID=A0ABS7DEV4_9GAMM|nr:anhydro-N-acetylmuramic acid kinase [Succinivibrio faecicola]MBW7569642.1 anhydro-N-acetylmuramic acid kinase [Succinivibrio faecicola]
MNELYIGLMSGTSIDGIDAVLAKFDENGKSTIIDSTSVDYDESTRELLHSLCSPSDNEIEKAGEARVKLADYESQAVLKLLEKTGFKASDIVAVGSHGQTVRHCPDRMFSIQLDDGARIAANTGIDTVCNFRAADIANGGNGAPLTQAFHSVLFGSDKKTFVLNLGGIANVSVIDNDENHTVLCAYDIGPANTLIDTVLRIIFKKKFDKDGEIAKNAKVMPSLLQEYLSNPYLSKPAPKSTGRETFNADMIKEELFIAMSNEQYARDLVATLTEFTVIACVNEIRKIIYKYSMDESRLIVCGGGAFNRFMMDRMRELLSKNNVEFYTADALGIDSKLIEAHAFAYFAYMFTHRRPLNLKDSTACAKNSVLGCLFPATR